MSLADWYRFNFGGSPPGAPGGSGGIREQPAGPAAPSKTGGGVRYDGPSKPQMPTEGPLERYGGPRRGVPQTVSIDPTTGERTQGHMPVGPSLQDIFGAISGRSPAGPAWNPSGGGAAAPSAGWPAWNPATGISPRPPAAPAQRPVSFRESGGEIPLMQQQQRPQLGGGAPEPYGRLPRAVNQPQAGGDLRARLLQDPANLQQLISILLGVGRPRTGFP